MTLPARVTRLFSTDPHDAGCGETFELIDRFVELVLGGGDPEVAFAGIAAHLRRCGPCAEDYAGLLAAVRDAGEFVGSVR